MNLIEKIIHSSEKIIFYVLSILVLIFVAYELFDLIYLLYSEIMNASILENKSIALSGVPLFFNIIIALEILETFKGDNENVLRKVKIILLIALTAISRKVIVMDVKHADFKIDAGISILILALCLGYFIISYKTKNSSNDKME